MKTRRFLLDTQAFLYAAQAQGPLSRSARQAILHPDNALFISLVSVWEMQIKLSLGKLKLPLSLPEAIQRAVTELGVEFLTLQPEHIFQLEHLPLHHRDPFDRLLIAQAQVERMALLSGDTMFDRYEVTRVW
jgi:PIN domain nuclease of toxin-antitoxin system